MKYNKNIRYTRTNCWWTVNFHLQANQPRTSSARTSIFWMVLQAPGKRPNNRLWMNSPHESLEEYSPGSKIDGGKIDTFFQKFSRSPKVFHELRYQRLTHFLTSEHPSNVSIFDPGLYYTRKKTRRMNENTCDSKNSNGTIYKNKCICYKL